MSKSIKHTLASLNESILSVVNEGTNVHQSYQLERTGYKQDEINEDVEQLDEVTNSEKIRIIRREILGSLESMGRKNDKVLVRVKESERRQDKGKDVYEIHLTSRFDKRFHEELAKQLGASLRDHRMQNNDSVGVYVGLKRLYK